MEIGKYILIAPLLALTACVEENPIIGTWEISDCNFTVEGPTPNAEDAEFYNENAKSTCENLAARSPITFTKNDYQTPLRKFEVYEYQISENAVVAVRSDGRKRTYKLGTNKDTFVIEVTREGFEASNKIKIASVWKKKS